jgi:hypothetical protein
MGRPRALHRRGRIKIDSNTVKRSIRLTSATPPNRLTRPVHLTASADDAYHLRPGQRISRRSSGPAASVRISCGPASSLKARTSAGRAVDGDEGASLGALAGDDAALPLLPGRHVASPVFNLPV